MAIARAFAPAVGWSPPRLRAFLDLDDPTQQSAYWRRYLDTRRFRAAFDGLLTITALRAVYASSLLEFLPPRLGPVMRERMARCFARHPNRSNPYARALLLGDLPDDPPPPEAQAIRLAHADAATYLEREPAGSFDGFALSNILDGADAGYKRRLVAAVKRASAAGRDGSAAQLPRSAGARADQPRGRRQGNALGRRRRQAGGGPVTGSALESAAMQRAATGTAHVDGMPHRGSSVAAAMARQSRSIETRIRFAAAAEKVWDALLFYEQIEQRPPLLLRLLLPLPIRTDGSKFEVGDEATVLVRGRTPAQTHHPRRRGPPLRVRGCRADPCAWRRVDAYRGLLHAAGAAGRRHGGRHRDPLHQRQAPRLAVAAHRGGGMPPVPPSPLCCDATQGRTGGGRLAAPAASYLALSACAARDPTQGVGVLREARLVPGRAYLPGCCTGSPRRGRCRHGQRLHAVSRSGGSQGEPLRPAWARAAAIVALSLPLTPAFAQGGPPLVTDDRHAG